MKIARIVALDQQAQRLGVVDVFTTDHADGSTPMKVPAGITDPIAWLRDVMFPGFSDTFEDRGEQFREVPARVNPSAAFIGSRDNPAHILDGTKYVNTNGTDGNGDTIPGP